MAGATRHVENYSTSILRKGCDSQARTRPAAKRSANGSGGSESLLAQASGRVVVRVERRRDWVSLLDGANRGLGVAPG